ncbi:AMP-binding protein [Streptomyces sp. RGM 3693]|uniref:AMP-binding protein n=1 Tax=Streptomyces sp. RGM 3693 TaxID=3413284 RepID=UPI003D2E796F
MPSGHRPRAGHHHVGGVRRRRALARRTSHGPGRLEQSASRADRRRAPAPGDRRTDGPAGDCRLRQVFGTAEGPLTFTRPTDPGETALTVQGRPLSPDDEIRIVDADGKDVPDGEPGELLARGPYTLHGYYRAPDHNARAFTADGYFRTGDLARRTLDGNLVVTGGLKDVRQAG